jgi:hypothetical protein
MCLRVKRQDDSKEGLKENIGELCADCGRNVLKEGTRQQHTNK